MIIYNWHLNFVITITALAYPQSGFASEFEPPFLLIDNNSSAANTSSSELIESKENPSPVTSSKTLINVITTSDHSDDILTQNEFDPPFLLFDEGCSASNTSSTDLIDNNKNPSPVTISEALNNGITTEYNSDDILDENVFNPPFLLTNTDCSEQNSTPTDLNITDKVPSPEIDSETRYKMLFKRADADDADDFLSEDMEIETSYVKPPFFSFLDSHQKLISNYLHLTVLSVDNFFATNQAINESTGSYLRLTFESRWPEGQGADFKGAISLRARLPGIQEKYKLVIESDPVEQKDLIEQQTGQISPDSTSTENRGLYTGIEKNVSRRGWKIRPSIGVKLRNPLDLYTRLRIDRNIYFEKWLLYLFQGFYWFDSTGFGSDSTMRWDKPLSRKFLFRTTSTIRYSDEFDIYDFSQLGEVIHTLDNKSALTYTIGTFGHSDTSVHATTYLASVLFRKNIHSDYLFMDIQPQIFFEKENNFEERYEIFLRLEFYYRD